MSKVDFESRAKQIRLTERRKFDKRLQEAVSAGIQQFRDDEGLDDDALESLRGRDQSAAELRKAKGSATKAQRAYEALEGKYKKVYSKLSNALTRDAVISAAAGKAVNPTDVWLHLQSSLRLEDDLSVSILDGEDPIDITMDEAVDNLLAENKHLALSTGTPGAGSRPSNGEGTEASGHDLSTPSGRMAFLKEQLG